jgi:cell division protein FtsQ
MRPVRGEEPDLDDAPVRKSRRASPAERPRPRNGSRKVESADRSWLPRLRVTSPMALIAMAFVGLAGFAGLVQGGHLGVPLPADAKGASSIMPVQQVTLSGLYYATRGEILGAAAVKPGDAMWDAAPAEVRERVLQVDWVDTAKVTRLWPATLKIEITEKEPFAIWQMDKKFWLIDRRGRQITQERVTEFAGLPMVVGLGAPARAAELVELLKRFPDLQRATKAAVRVGERRWDLHLKSGIQVRLPETGETEALKRLIRIDEEQQVLSRDIRAIDLRFPDRMIIKPRKGADQTIEGQDT